MRSRLTVIDLFAGAGLFGYAFAKAGFQLLRAIELDAAAARTYAHNLGNHIEVGDVARIKPTGRCDVLIAGPPCQGFSTLGPRRRDDPRNGLSLSIIPWAKVTRPRIIVVENVAAFLESPTWAILTKRLVRLGYEVAAFELDAADYGVPQLRRRSFTIASMTGRLPEKPRCCRSRMSVREAWEGLPIRPDGHNWHLAPKPSALALARMRLIPPGGDKRDVMSRAPHLAPPSWWRLSCQVTDAWGRMEWDQPCNTLRTAMQNASKGRYIHPSQHRVISLREGARLHTIPDDWIFEGFPSYVARQIGNSVPPRLGYAIARSVLSLL